MSRLVLVAAGGTGGHLFPAAAFAEALRARGWRVVLMTDARGRRYAQGFPAEAIEETPAATIAGANPFKIAAAGLKIAAGIAAARARLKTLKPALVAGFGGYPSLPALWAARAAKIPILIHEQNAVLGRVNRYFAKDAQAVACGFERLDKLIPGAEARKVVTGNPTRAAIRAVRDKPYPLLPAGEPVRLLVIGGSQGARLFGETIPAAVALLPEGLRGRLRLTQQVREEQLEAVRTHYAAIGVAADLAPFFTDMGALLAEAHLVIIRGGASSVTELAVAGRPGVIVPGDFATDDHQGANAEALAAIGAADVMRERDFTPQALADLLERRLSDAHGLSVRAAAARAAGRADAAGALAALAERLASPAPPAAATPR